MAQKPTITRALDFFKRHLKETTPIYIRMQIQQRLITSRKLSRFSILPPFNIKSSKYIVHTRVPLKKRKKQYNNIQSREERSRETFSLHDSDILPNSLCNQSVQIDKNPTRKERNRYETKKIEGERGRVKAKINRADRAVHLHAVNVTNASRMRFQRPVAVVPVSGRSPALLSADPSERWKRRRRRRILSSGFSQAFAFFEGKIDARSMGSRNRNI